MIGLLGFSASTPGAPPPSAALSTDRDALAQLWTGMYDITEELVTSEALDSPLEPVTTRVQIHVRRLAVPWLSTHVLYVEEHPYDEPFELRRRVLLSIDPERAADGSLRVRQYTRKADTGSPGTLTASDVESVPGCDLFLKREGAQFRGGTRGRNCLDTGGPEQRWLDYRVVIGDGLFWYRKRRLNIPGDEVAEEIAGFPHAELEDARLFSCGISWAAKDKAPRRQIDSVDLHDRGGRARFRTPDGRELQLELHGRDWPLSEGRESLVLTLTDGKADSDAIASSWTSLGAARVGIDIGWLVIDCAPVVSETGEQRS
ncbi:MAG TPA: CpcT/CpeT family chromophore lyase [Steroidobacteraceae bacterium]|nr:CpcT/CpeT family chromophore lyase [Steroidobacteraceae bacterium]